MKYIRILILCQIFSCGGEYSPKYNIYVYGTNDVKSVDKAWETACGFVDADPYKLAHKTVVNFDAQTTPVRISGVETEYHGLSTNYPDMSVERVQVIGDCLLDSETPACHEFFHSVLYLIDGDQDSNHINSHWHEADQNYGPCE